MNELTKQLDTFLGTINDEQRLLSTEQNKELAELIGDFVSESKNKQSLADIVNYYIPKDDHSITFSIGQFQRSYVFYLILIAVSRQYPDIFDEHEFSDDCYFNANDTPASLNSLIFKAITSTMITQIDSLKTDFYSTYSIFTNDEPYVEKFTYEQYSEIYKLGKTRILQNNNRILFDIVFEFISECKSCYLHDQLEENAMYALKELSSLLRMQEQTSQTFDMIRIKIQVETLLIGNLLQALSENACKLYIEIGIDDNSTEAALLEEKALDQLAGLLIKTTQQFECNEDTASKEDAQEAIDEVLEMQNYNTGDIIISSSEERQKAETFEFFVVSILLPFYEALEHLQALQQGNQEYDYYQCYSGCINFNKAVEFAFAEGNYNLIKTINTSEREDKLFYQELFELLCCKQVGKGAAKRNCKRMDNDDDDNAEEARDQSTALQGADERDQNDEIAKSAAAPVPEEQAPQEQVSAVSLLVTYFSQKAEKLDVGRLATYLYENQDSHDVAQHFLMLFQSHRFSFDYLREMIEKIDQLEEDCEETALSGAFDSVGYLLIVKSFELLTSYIYGPRMLLQNLKSETLREFLEKQFTQIRNEYFSCIEFQELPDIQPFIVEFDQKLLYLDFQVLKQQNYAIQQIVGYLSEDFYHFEYNLSKAALNSSDLGRALVYGNMELLQSMSFLENIRIDNLSVYLLFEEVFELLDGAELKAVFKELFLSSKDMRLAILDAIGSAGLGYDRGSSLIQIKINKSTRTAEMIEEDENNLINTDISKTLNKNFMSFCKEFYDINSQMPFRFLYSVENSSIVNMKIILKFLEYIKIDDLVGENEIYLLLTNASIMYSYLMGETQHFPAITELLRLIDEKFELFGFYNKNYLEEDVEIAFRYSELKYVLLMIMSDNYESGVSQLENIEQMIPLNLQKQIDQIRVTRSLIDDQQFVSNNLVSELFLPCIFNELNSEKLEIKSLLIKKEEYEDIDEKFDSLEEINFADNILLDKFCNDSMFALYVLFSNSLFDENCDNCSDSIDILEKFATSTDFTTERASYNEEDNGKTLFEAIALISSQRCFELYSHCEDKEDYVVILFEFYVKLLADVCKEEIFNCTHIDCGITTILNVLFSGMYEFVKDNKAELILIDKNLIFSYEKKSIYYIILQTIIKITEIYQLPEVTTISYMVEKELIELLNKDELLVDDLLNLLLKINNELNLTINELKSILKHSLITSSDSSGLLISISLSSQPLELCELLLEECEYNKKNYIYPSSYGVIEAPKLTYFDKRNASLMPLPIELLLVFRFHPELRDLANEVIEYIWNIRETYLIETSTLQTVVALLELYKLFYTELLYNNNAFLNEIFQCIKLALKFIFQAGILENDQSSFTFIDSIVSFIEFEDIEAFLHNEIDELLNGVEKENSAGTERNMEGPARENISNGPDQSLTIEELLIELLLYNISLSTNFEVYLNYCFENLIIKALARASDKAACELLLVILELLYINSPITMMELFNEISLTNTQEAFCILLAISHRTRNNEELLLQYFILNYLSIERTFEPIMEEYEVMEHFKYFSEHNDEILREMNMQEEEMVFNKYLKQYIREQEIEVFDKKFAVLLNKYEHFQTTFISFGIYTAVLQVIVQKIEFLSIMNNYYILIKNSVLLSQQDFTFPFYTIYRAILDSLDIIIEPAYLRAASSLELQNILSESSLEKAQFSTSSYYLLYMQKRLFFALNYYTIVDIEEFELAYYTIDQEVPVDQELFESADVRKFVKSYLQDTVIYRQRFYPEEAENITINIITLLNSLTDPSSQLEQSSKYFSATKSYDLSTVIFSKGEYVPSFSIQIIALLIEMASELYEELLCPEELSSELANEEYKQLQIRTQYVPNNSIYYPLLNVTIALSHIVRSAQNYSYVAFSSILDLIETLFYGKVTDESSEYIENILINVVISCPNREITVRAIQGFLRLIENGFCLEVQALLLSYASLELEPLSALMACYSKGMRLVKQELDGQFTQKNDLLKQFIEFYKLDEAIALLSEAPQVSSPHAPEEELVTITATGSDSIIVEKQ